MADAPRGRSPESEPPPAAPAYEPRIDHYRWNVIENEPGWSITASPWGPPKPTLSDPRGKLSVLWIHDNKRKGWKVHEIVEGHPSSRYGQYTPDAVRRAPIRSVPRAPGADSAGSSRTVKKEEPVKHEQVKREPGGNGGSVDL